MEPKNSQTLKRRERQEPKSATSLVECAIRVSPTLARLIRKCAVTEAGGASAHDALFASAGIRPSEVKELRDQAERLMEELRQARKINEQLQGTLDLTEAVVAQRHEEQNELLRQLRNAEKERHQTAAAVAVQLAGLQKTIDRQEGDLTRSISVEGMDESATLAMKTLKDRLNRGEDVKTAALGTAGYEPRQVATAMAKQDRDEMRAFDSLLARPTWRRRVVLRLLDARIER